MPPRDVATTISIDDDKQTTERVPFRVIIIKLDVDIKPIEADSAKKVQHKVHIVEYHICSIYQWPVQQFQRGGRKFSGSKNQIIPFNSKIVGIAANVFSVEIFCFIFKF